eukprot:scaffold1872_cov268-Chaetoceros_neogracile.AAC.15
MGLRSYLSAFICIALISGKVSAKRPKYVPQKIMQLGCLPGSNVCPAQMYCLIDPNYAYFGTCACAGLHGKELAPPTYDENVPELTMSKRLASMVFGLMSALELGDYARLLKLSTTVLPIILTTACLVVAPLLIRVLCKDMRNVTHPNWKAAAAIRRSAFNQPFSEMALFAGVRAYTATSFWAYQGAIIVNAILVVMWFYRLVSAGEWFGYMLFAHRRHLKEDETARISQYFGFTKLGLNGSIASEIMSRISSVTSSVVDDKEEDTESKKEIA